MSSKKVNLINIERACKSSILLVVPITICILFVLFIYLNVFFESELDKSPNTITHNEQSIVKKSIKDIKWYELLYSVAFFLSFIAIATFGLLLLFKFGFYKIIYYWLCSSTLVLLFFISSTILRKFFVRINFCVDFITIVCLTFNNGFLGMLSIFNSEKMPKILGQFYLIFISSMVAIQMLNVFTGFACWAVLFAVSIWDVYAVLFKTGPLNLILKIIKERNIPILPAMIYSAWLIMVKKENKKEDKKNKKDKKDKKDKKETNKKQLSISSSSDTRISKSIISLPTKKVSSISSESYLSNESTSIVSDIPSTDQNQSKNLLTKSSIQDQIFYDIEKESVLSEGAIEVERAFKNLKKDKMKEFINHLKQNPNRSLSKLKMSSTDSMENDEDKDQLKEQAGTKLGLGDFVFYSVLVGKSSQTLNFFIILSTTLSMSIGLLLTLIILILVGKPMPALPISISIGILVYTFSFHFMIPFQQELNLRTILI